MKLLQEDLIQRKREIKYFLQDKNRWSKLPPIVDQIIDNNIERITFISGNPDNVNGQIRQADNCEYYDIKDQELDFSLFEEWAIVNCRPGNKRGHIRINFIPIKDLKDEEYDIICLEHKVDEKNFLNSLMGGK